MEIWRQAIAIQRKRWKEKGENMCARGDLSQGWSRNLFSLLPALLTWDMIRSSLHLSFLSCRKKLCEPVAMSTVCAATHTDQKGQTALPALWSSIYHHRKALLLRRWELALLELTEAWGFAFPEKWRSGKQHRNAEYYYSSKHCL